MALKTLHQRSAPVRVVKHDLLHQGEESQLRQGPVEGRQLRATGISSQAHEVVNSHHDGARDEQLVDGDASQRLTELHRVHLEGAASQRGRQSTQKHEFQQMLPLSVVSSSEKDDKTFDTNLPVLLSVVQIFICVPQRDLSSGL